MLLLLMLVTPKGPQALRNTEYWRSLNIYHNLVWFKGMGGGGGVGSTVYLLELGEGIEDVSQQGYLFLHIR